MGCHFLLQGIFQTQELNPSLPHCRCILCHWATRMAWGKSQRSLKSCQVPVFFTSWAFWGLTAGHGCSLMAAGWQANPISQRHEMPTEYCICTCYYVTYWRGPGMSSQELKPRKISLTQRRMILTVSHNQLTNTGGQCIYFLLYGNFHRI